MEEQEFTQKIYDPNDKKLISHASNLTKNSEAVKDLKQDTIVKAWRKISSYDKSKSQPLTWLKKIMTNTFLDSLRKEKNTTVLIPGSKYDEEPIYSESYSKIVSKFPKIFRFYSKDKERNMDVYELHESNEIKKAIERDQKALEVLYKIAAINNRIPDKFKIPNNVFFQKGFFTPNPSHHKRLLHKIHLINNAK